VYKESSDFKAMTLFLNFMAKRITQIYTLFTYSRFLEKKRDFLKISPIIFTEESLCYTRKGKIYFIWI